MGIEGGAGGVNPNPSELTFQVTESDNRIDSVKQVGEATTDNDTGITSLSYEVKMTTADGRARSFKITVGYDENQLGEITETIGKIVKSMGADDILAASGSRISTRLDGSGQTSVTSLKATGSPTQTLDQLQTTNSKLADSIGRVINCFHHTGLITRETDLESETEIGEASDPRREALELLDEIEREYGEGETSSSHPIGNDDLMRVLDELDNISDSFETNQSQQGDELDQLLDELSQPQRRGEPLDPDGNIKTMLSDLNAELNALSKEEQTSRQVRNNKPDKEFQEMRNLENEIRNPSETEQINQFWDGLMGELENTENKHDNIDEMLKKMDELTPQTGQSTGKVLRQPNPHIHSVTRSLNQNIHRNTR